MVKQKFLESLVTFVTMKHRAECAVRKLIGTFSFGALFFSMYKVPAEVSIVSEP